jgi:putative hydrolase of the HAD superfamily
LQWLKKQGLKVGIVTNGNADVTESPEVGQYIDFCISADKVGAAKPSVVPFLAACQLTDSKPWRTLVIGDICHSSHTLSYKFFLGDSYLNDVIGAQNAGMHALWLNRLEENVSDAESSKPAEWDETASFIKGITCTVFARDAFARTS